MLTAATCGKRSSSEETKLQYCEATSTGAALGLPYTLRISFCEPAFLTASPSADASESVGCV